MGQLDLPPGFRFSPTDEELVLCFLYKKAFGKTFYPGVIAEVDIYKFEPWDLPEKSLQRSGYAEWYFFHAQTHTARINRTTSEGYWKATGKDRKVCRGACIVGVKKTLVYYEGRARSGRRTDWIMHEYRLDEESEKKANQSVVLCRVRKKGGSGPRNGEQYGAPVLYENDETEASDDVDEKLLEPPKSTDQSLGFNPPDQPEVLKQTTLPEIPPERHTGGGHSGMEELGTEFDPDVVTLIQSFISDTTEGASLESGMMFSMSDKEGETIPCHLQVMEMQNADTIPVCPSLLDLDCNSLHDVSQLFLGEAEILEEMLHLAAPSQGDVSNVGLNERILSQAPTNNHDSLLSDDDYLMVGDYFELSDGWILSQAPTNNHDSLLSDDDYLMVGDYFELEDISSPLDGFVPRSPIEFATGEEQKLPVSMADNRVATHRWVPDVLHTQGSAACRARLQIPASGGNTMNANVLQQCEAIHSVFPEGGMNMQRVSNDVGSQIARYTRKNGEESFVESSSGSGFVESSTRSFLSKHMSFYAVSKCEAVPSPLYQTAFTDPEDEDLSNDSTVSSSALMIKDLSKVDTSAFKEDSFTPVASSGASHLHTVTSSTQEASRDFEAAHDPSSAFGHHGESETKYSNNTFLGRYLWNTAFGGLVSRAKSSSLGVRMIQLGNCLQTRFNEKVSTLGKQAACFFPEKGYLNPYNSLRRGVMVSLFHLAATFLILFCLFLGFSILTKNALPFVYD